MPKIDEIIARQAAATPGEWKRHPNPRSWLLLPIDVSPNPNNENDAELCVHAKTDIEWLTERLERCREVLVSLKASHQMGLLVHTPAYLANLESLIASITPEEK